MPRSRFVKTHSVASTDERSIVQRVSRIDKIINQIQAQDLPAFTKSKFKKLTCNLLKKKSKGKSRFEDISGILLIRDITENYMKIFFEQCLFIAQYQKRKTVMVKDIHLALRLHRNICS